MSEKLFKDKVVIITGASSGIGEACVRAFDNAGAKVVLASRNIQNLLEISKTLQHENLCIATEVSDENDCKNLIEKTIQKFGQIDILVNNAGITMRAIFADVDLTVIKKIMDVNFWGTVYCTKYALPYLLQNKGSIIGVSSIAGFVGLPARTGYSASKFAINGFLESLRIENLKTGLHVLTACPGYTKTNIRFKGLDKNGKAQADSPRDESSMMTSDEVANEILKAITKKKKYLILTRKGKLTVFLNKIFFGKIDKLVFNSVKKEPDSPF